MNTWSQQQEQEELHESFVNRLYECKPVKKIYARGEYWKIGDKKRLSGFFCVACHRETVDRFEFEVRASDSGREESLSATARVRITVTDTNDHTPTFDAFPFRINISTASPPRFVLPYFC